MGGMNVWDPDLGEWVPQPSGTGGSSDHGSLTGLADDDHPQYLTEGRGDARYSGVGHNHAGAYDPAGTAASAVAAHVADANPHTGYLQKSGGTMTGNLTIQTGVQSEQTIRSVSQRLWFMSRDSNLTSYIASSDENNVTKRPLEIQASTLTLSGGAQTPTASAHVATKGYVDGRTWYGTQAAYDAISPKDATVLYVVTG